MASRRDLEDAILRDPGLIAKILSFFPKEAREAILTDLHAEPPGGSNRQTSPAPTGSEGEPHGAPGNRPQAPEVKPNTAASRSSSSDLPGAVGGSTRREA